MRWFDCDGVIVHVRVHFYGDVRHVEKKKVLPSWLLEMSKTNR